MELRHLKYFTAVAEELHFARAAERLHIEQSPLSRAIKDLEYDLDVQLLKRTTRSTELTWAGQVFLDQARRVLAMVSQAKVAAKSAAQGYRGHLRIAVSDGLAQPRLSSLLARCRKEEPDVEIHLFEMPFAQQVSGLRHDLLDAGFALASDVGVDLVAKPVWTDPVAVVVPARHPLMAHKRIPLAEALKYPLVMCHPEAGSGCHQQIEAMLRSHPANPTIADYVTSLELMLTLVGAGYGIGFAIASQVALFQRDDVVVRPIAGRAPTLVTYLLYADRELSEPLQHFMARTSLPT
ncbi:LysR family transcriptional regulator [Rhodanobacter glycinis]|uniref:LysR family transcriptional regulator n=1 Tax=Rhodanobacter glycinis TaxID=582702 RepID=A0A5B9E049_9GAMM|nr:LysR substrate-binding domain-containing protein [Rhodanobacter glycinis]QEE24934.1 LysR family transcriptional regulator [Rhodanobacter glycinis]